MAVPPVENLKGASETNHPPPAPAACRDAPSKGADVDAILDACLELRFGSNADTAVAKGRAGESVVATGRDVATFV